MRRSPVIKIRFIDLLITHINLSIEAREIDIDPIGGIIVFKKTGILYYGCIHRVFESIGITGLVENGILMFGKIDLEISTCA
jgi:hypothetical protein